MQTVRMEQCIFFFFGLTGIVYSVPVRRIKPNLPGSKKRWALRGWRGASIIPYINFIWRQDDATRDQIPLTTRQGVNPSRRHLGAFPFKL